MALPPLADLTDIEERIAPATIEPGSTSRVESLIKYASALVRRHTGCRFVDEDDDPVDPLPDGVNEVVVSMVERASTNPDGVTQTTTGPFTVSFGPDAAQRVYLTSGDKTILAPIRCRPALWGQPTTRGEIETRSVLDRECIVLSETFD